MPYPAWVASLAPGAEQATGITFAKPSGVANGDVLVVVIRSQATKSGEITLPTGWQRGGTGSLPASDRVLGIFYKYIPTASSESATSYAFTSIASGSSRIIGAIGIMRGVDPSFLNDGGIAYSTSATLASSTAGGVPYTAVALWGAEFTAGNSVVPSAVPSGFTNTLTVQTAGGTSPAPITDNSSTSGSRTGIVVATRGYDSGTTVPSLVTTWSGSPTDPKSALWLVRGLATSNPGSGVPAKDGAGNTVSVFYTSQVGVAKTPQALVPMRRGFQTLADMDAKAGATWAHRGGSASYPEHSLYAYTQSIARGYGVLELSMQRSSDGVWFGCHDLDLARVTGNSSLTQDVRTLPWSTINSYNITIGAQGAPQPFMRWQDIVAAGYHKAHILVLDPKNSVGSYQAEFISMVQNDVGTSNVIMKWAGGLTSFATAASNAGFATAGYWYQADYDNGNLLSQSPYWTYLGMDIGATTAWTGTNNVKSLATAQGKKVWGHIATTQSDYNTAISKGADLVQCAGVGVITPVSWWN